MGTINQKITKPRADLVQWAVDLSGGQKTAARILGVTPATVSRWTRMVGPIPQSIVLWAKSVVEMKRIAAEEV